MKVHEYQANELMARVGIPIPRGGVASTPAEVKEIAETGVRVEREGEPGFVEADSIVLAVGMRAESRLAEELKNKVARLYVIGDGAQPQGIAEAVENGLRTGCML